MRKGPIRIVFVTENLFGGTGVHTAAFAEYLAAHGDHVVIQCAAAMYDAGGAKRILPASPAVQVMEIPALPQWPSRRVRAGWTALLAGADAVFLPKGGPFDGSIVQSVLLALAGPVVVFEHDAPPYEWLLVPPVRWQGGIPRLGLHRRLPRMRAALRRRFTRKVVTNSTSTAENQRRYYGQHVDEVVPLAVEVGRFRRCPPFLPRTVGRVRIGLVGRADVYMKGLDLAFEAIASLRGLGERIEVVLAVPPSERSRIDALAATSGMANQLELIDPVAPDALPGLYSSFDGLLVASRYEGGPYTMLEAMACGTPVIATPVGLVPEVIEDGVNGIRVAATDSVPALVEGLQRFLALSAAERDLMGRAARETIVRHHDAEQHFARLREILHEVARR
jgi:glycosyltransferase involved in cell wall biosynthesis